MKTTFGSALVLSATVAFVGVAAAPCNTTTLSQLTMTENVSTCGADSGYSLTSMAMPSDAQITALCNSDACQESINAVKQVAPDECTIGSIRLYADVINPLLERCDMSPGSASASAPSSGSGPKADDVGTGSLAGNATFPASASMAGSATDQPITTTPQPNTRPTTRSPSPSPTPTSSPAAGNGGTDAPTLSMCAAIAVLAAVVAAIL